MTKDKFTEVLEKRLQVLPRSEQLRILCFYEETIDDCMEDGMSEEAAVASVGDIDVIVHDILVENKLNPVQSKQPKEKKLHPAWKPLLVILTSPVWISLLAVACFLALIGYLLLGGAYLLLALLWLLPLCIIISCLIVIPFQISHHIAYTVFVFGILLLSTGAMIDLSLEIKSWFQWLKQQGMAFHAYILKQYQNLRTKVVF